MELNFIECDGRKGLMNKLQNFLEIKTDLNLDFPHGNKAKE